MHIQMKTIVLFNYIRIKKNIYFASNFKENIDEIKDYYNKKIEEQILWINIFHTIILKEEASSSGKKFSSLKQKCA